MKKIYITPHLLSLDSNELNIITTSPPIKTDKNVDTEDVIYGGAKQITIVNMDSEDDW